ncbi:cell division protein FtsA [Lacicoccus alkaliphilus]|uniref:Cell division protein FtsA n=1 Tax=Lacicoccus alkaliphilus DSM 16010 TaxID=1123231 RepID=A0A1M7CGI2_9BACL|nr:cell division protein FtsA [Salinicoccus alkaliphilus]SHL66343.1 cell division protein FtsA [Salinicoccus alkaliphilus DSM 16010]
MKEHYYVALDIGSSSIKAVVGEKFHDGVNIIGTGQTFTDGISKGMITDFELAKSAIKDTVKKASISSGVEIDEVFLKMPITDSEMKFGEEAIRFGGESTEIKGEHIESLLESIREKELGNDLEVVTVFPVHFIVDDLHEVKDPKDMVATQSLSVKAGIVLINRTLLINTVKCVEESGLTVLDVYSDAVNFEHILTDAEAELGSVVIDIGAELTQYAYYERGGLKYASSIPVGGNLISSDLSQAFDTPYDIADKMKTQYGHAFFDMANDEDIIRLPQINSEDAIEVTPKDLADIIELRLEEMLLGVFEDLQQRSINKVSGGFIVTGGTANLLGVKELMQDMVSEKVRIHIPNQMGARKPEFSSAISTVSSGISFDELLEYVTIDNYDTAPVNTSAETPDDSDSNFFSGLFKTRKDKNEAVERPAEDSPAQHEKVQDDAEYEEYTDYSYDDGKKVSDGSTVEKRPKEARDVSGYMKKLFKNLFE